jgi:hypothetical protein
MRREIGGRKSETVSARTAGVHRTPAMNIDELALCNPHLYAISIPQNSRISPN